MFVLDRQTGDTTIVSLDRTGGPANGNSTLAVISDDGRYVAFTSRATDLVVGDTNEFVDVYLHDRQASSTVLVSRTPSGSAGNGNSGSPAISADGASVVFESFATDLVGGDTNGIQDVFVFDVATAAVEAVSVGMDGTTSNHGGGDGRVAAGGRYIVFESRSSDIVSEDHNDRYDIYLRDVVSGTTSLVSRRPDGRPGDKSSYAPDISSDGRFVAFWSKAKELAPGEGGAVMVLDRDTGDLTRVVKSTNSIYSNGANPDITSTGFVSFSTRGQLDPADKNRNSDNYVKRFR